MRMLRWEAPASRHRARPCRKLAAWTGSNCLPYTPRFSLFHASAMSDAAPKPPNYPLPVLALGRYRLRFREDQREDGVSLLSPETGYLGSAWRGAFGHALRRMVAGNFLEFVAGCGYTNCYSSCGFDRRAQGLFGGPCFLGHVRKRGR